MDDLFLPFAYGPQKDTWIEAYDPETGQPEPVQVNLPVIIHYMLRPARVSEVKLIKGRTRKQLYHLAIMGLPPLILTEETLGKFGLKGYHSPAVPATTRRRPRTQAQPVLVGSRQ